MPRHAAIDIGSNAVRLLIGSVSPNGRILVQRKCREPIRLGADVFQGGRISKRSYRKLVQAFEKFRRLSVAFDAVRMTAVATSAFREAENKKGVVSKLALETGIRVNVISAQTEARLVYSAVHRALPHLASSGVFFDIGGGSVEVAYFSRGAVREIHTLPIGTVRLLTKHGSEDSAVNYLNTYRLRLKRLFQKFGVVHQLVGTGGNTEALSEIALGPARGGSRCVLALNDVVNTYCMLRQFSPKRRVIDLDLRADRADVIAIATQTVLLMMEASGCTDISIPRVGLREGVLGDAAEPVARKRILMNSSLIH